MLQIIGLIVVVYTIARLLQVPLERKPNSDSVLWIISILAVLAIGFLAFMLMASGASMPNM